MMMIIMMTQVPSWSYLNNPASHANTSHLMLKWFNSDLVLRNIQVSTSLKFFNSDKISTLSSIVSILYIDIHKAWRKLLLVPYSPC